MTFIRNQFATVPAFAACLLLQASCATQSPSLVAATPFCSVADLEFHTDFEGARLYACATGDSGPVLTIAPEFAPINPSSWYAWRVVPADPGEVIIRQRYLHGQHRYDPWISLDGVRWDQLPADATTRGKDGEIAFRVRLPENGLYIAAQPILSNAGMEEWAARLAARHGLDAVPVARTPGGRAVTAWQMEPTEARGLVVFIGRQHPPEVTGGQAFQDFVERIFMADDLAVKFRSQFAIGLLPNLNPDGMARGHWRTNRRGVDLNRDWGPFTEAETRGAAAWITALDQRTPLLLFLDFHSTWLDVFYTQHESDNPHPHGFTTAWKESLQERLGDDMPAWSGSHNPGLPTAKTWVRKIFDATAITYEVADTTPRPLIRKKAVAAAEEMMKLMLTLEVESDDRE